MKPIWHPVSSVFMPDPPVLATPVLVNLLLRSGAGVELLYAGDRMWPVLRHGSRVQVLPPEGEPRSGQTVLCDLEGVVDILRVDHVREDGLILAGDADSGPAVQVTRDQILGVVDGIAGTVSGMRRILARQLLDLGEMFRTWNEPEDDPSDSVLSKYDYQAQFYAVSPGESIDPELLQWIGAELPPGRRILVAGCGTGQECIALALQGYKVVGIDFSPEMIGLAEKAAADRKLDIRFEVADLRTHTEPVCSLDAVLFTYDVYSFIPEADQRFAVLTGIENWLKPEGVVFLSARHVASLWAGMVLTKQWILRRLRGRKGGWGAGHTRWIAGDATLRRSFVQHFTQNMLELEIANAGFVMGRRYGGHTLLRKRLQASPVRLSKPLTDEVLGQEC